MAGRLLASRVSGRAATAVLLTRLAAGLIFAAGGLAKFTDHATEVASFDSYGLPSPDAFVWAIGVLEVGGGLALLAGAATRLIALALAGDMIGAIVVSGLAKGEIVSLTLAPALLVAMAVLLWTGAGERSVDAALLARRPASGPSGAGP